MPTENANDANHQEPPRQRDSRFDVGRGVALWIIYSDHISGNILKQFTPISLGFSDMAEVFVFLSGHVGGMAFRKRMQREGTWGGFRRASARMGQIYVAWVLAFIAFALTSDCLKAWFPKLLVRNAQRYEATRDNPGLWLIDILLLRVSVSDLAILTIYFWFVLLLPAAVWLAMRKPCLLAFISFTLYVSVQLFPDLMTPPDLWGHTWYFNPFAWQVVFMAGVLLSSSPSLRARFPRCRLAIVISALVLEAALLAKLFLTNASVPFIGKTNLGVLRILHFAAVLVVARALMRPSMALWKSRWLRPWVLCGQNSLMVFCVGVVLASIATTFLDWGGYAALWQGVVNLAGWLLLTATAALWATVKRKTRRQLY